MLKIKYLFIPLILLSLSCTNHSEDDLIIKSENPILVTYEQNVKSIINNNCVSCHGSTPSNGAPMSLTTYNQVKDAVLNRGLLDRISRTTGEPGLMPNGGPRLPQQTIDIVVKWNSDGLLE
ncbi:c-type cytochrome [Flavobacterium ponti]|uniref:C-type cytochrome n=1 Tax=Flavobacterium ponti TaxID=665133 RepID=A0ABV9P7M9_9FLAO